MIQQLPEEIIAEIFSFLHSKFNILINSLVCKKWNATIRLVHLKLKLSSHSELVKFFQLFDDRRDEDDQNIDEFSSYSLSIKKFSAVGGDGRLTVDRDIEKLCSLLNANALECLKLRGDTFSWTSLKLIVDKFPKLKSLDIRGYKSDYQYLLECRKRLPELVKLKVEFDYLFSTISENKSLSIKPQIKSLAIHSDRFSRISILPKLDFENVESLDLEGNITLDISNLPLKLKKLSLSHCFANMKGLENISENLEYFSLNDVQTHEFEYFEKCEFKNLKSLTFKNMSNVFWERIYSSNELKPLNLTRLNVSGNAGSISLISKIANLASLTSLDISSNVIDLQRFKELMGKCEWKNLTEFDISLNPLNNVILPILEGLPSLKVLNAKSDSMKDFERGLLLSLGVRKNIQVDCAPQYPEHVKLEETKDEQSCADFLNSLSIPSTNYYSNPKNGTLSSFDFDKSPKIFIKRVQGVTNAQTNFKPYHTLSYFIEGKLLHWDVSKNYDRKYTKSIPHSDCLEWNEEIVFDSIHISDLSCDSMIELSLFCLILNPITGIATRKCISRVECPIFDSNLELQQGNVKLFSKQILQNTLSIDTSLSMEVSFEEYEHSVKYEIEKIPPNRVKESFEKCESVACDIDLLSQWKQKDIDINNPDKFVPFLRNSPLENSWVVYLAKQYVAKWQKPQHIMKILTILSENISNSAFIKLVITEMLNDIDDDVLVSLLPYLTACIKFDSINGVLTQYLLKRALRSRVIGDQFFWLLKVESHKHPICKIVLSQYMEKVNIEEREIIQNQCLFFDSVEQMGKGNIIQDFSRPLFIPFHNMTEEVVSIIPSQQRSQIVVQLEFNSGEFLQVVLSPVDHLYNFIIDSFVEANRFWIDAPCIHRKIRNYPIAFGRGFTISPINLQKVGGKEPKLSEITASKSQLFKDTLLQTAAFDAFIAHTFESTNPSAIYVDNEGHLERNYCYPKSFERVLGLVIKIERMIYGDLGDYLRKENLFEPFKQLIDRLANSFLENVNFIIYYMKPFGHRQRNLTTNIENRIKFLESYKYQ